ncbi:Uncharacterised protein [Klebsiella pneumoniae]|nr:Uncharacterised protein [Klebsiella pneumoniae]
MILSTIVSHITETCHINIIRIQTKTKFCISYKVI